MEFIEPSDRQVYTCDISVHPEDIDDLNHVNNVVYLRWVQEAASAHWLSKANSTTLSECLWVVLRHEIDYKTPAILNTLLGAKTWVGEFQGTRSERFVVITDRLSGKVYAQAKTIWCLLDPVSKKPKRISKELDELLKKAP